ncbi:MAG: hypothetical protein CML04_00660 [Pseudozobellia sp.]|nr:hypothetical protein [Pseudozobellia sp.]MBG48069.1 hypothetical protein [Pseudozobellia sp.]
MEIEFVLGYLSNLFENQYCKFYILDTFSYRMSGLETLRFLQEDDSFFEKPRKTSEDKLRSVILEHRLEHSNVKHTFHPITECSNILGAVQRNVMEFEMDLIVLFMNSANRAYDHQISSILNKIRRCPIMVIPENMSLSRRNKFVFVSDFMNPVPQGELDYMLFLFGYMKLEFKILQIGQPCQISLQQEINHKTLHLKLSTISQSMVSIRNINSLDKIKEYGSAHTKSILCFLDEKPSVLRRLGVTKSFVNRLGPIDRIPMVTFHV